MKTLLKVIAILVGLVVVVVVAAVIVLPMVFDPNDHKERIAAAVKESTGRDLRIEGDIGVTVFPWLGAEVGAVSLSNAPGFPGDYFARTERVDVRIKLVPLLKREVEMSTVTLHGLELNLVRDEKGRTNWEGLAKEKRAGKDRPAAPEGSGRGIAALAIGGLDVQKAALHWTDRRAKRELSITDLRVQTGPIALGQPVDLEVGFNVEVGEPAVAGAITMRAALDAGGSGQVFRADGFVLEADLRGQSLPGGEASLRVAADVSADMGKQTAKVQGLEVAVLGLEAKGNLAVTKFLAEVPGISGTVEIARFEPRALLAALGAPDIETADAGALSGLGASLSFAGSPQRLTLEPLVVKLDETTLQGKVELANLAAPVPAVRFDLAVDGIDADRYLPPASEKPAATPAVATASAGALPLETLRALDVDGKFRMVKLKLANMNLTDIALALEARNGVITLSPATAKLYGGSYSGTTRIDVRGPTPKLAIEEKLSNVQAGPLLDDLQGEGRLTGTADADMSLTAVGASGDEVRRTLNGTARFSFGDGALKGVNVARMIREAQARLKGQSLPPEKAELATDFSALTGTIRFKDGVATNDDLLAKSPLLRIEGKGTADLRTEQMDYRIRTTLVATTKGQGGAELGDLAGVPIPIKVTGSFKQPSYGLDFEAFASAVAKSRGKELVGKQKEAAKAKVEKAIGDKLGGDKAKGLLKGLLD